MSELIHRTQFRRISFLGVGVPLVSKNHSVPVTISCLAASKYVYP